MALAREEVAEDLGEPPRLIVRDEVASAGDSVDGEYPPPAGAGDRRCDRVPDGATFSPGVQEDDRIEPGPARCAERPVGASQLDLIHYFGIPKLGGDGKDFDDGTTTTTHGRPG